MAFYSQICSFVETSARISRKFSRAEARELLWNSNTNLQIEPYEINFSYAEGMLPMWPARLEFNVHNKETGVFVARVRLHTYEGDEDDLPVIPESTIRFVAGDLQESILRDEEGESIPFESMDFGTKHDPQCGICESPQPFDVCQWSDKDDETMIEDVICDACTKKWEYDGDLDAYVKKE